MNGRPAGGPWRCLAVVTIYALLGALTYQGATSPWSPVMTAWSGDTVPADLIRGQPSVGIDGGRRVSEQELPQLSRAGRDRRPPRPGSDHSRRRLTGEQLIDQISNGTPGGGNMPAYGKQVSPAEMSALVAFLAALRGDEAAPKAP